MHGKIVGADAASSGGAVVFSEGELCDYAFGYAAFPLCVSGCSFLGEQLTYVIGNDLHPSVYTIKSILYQI